jgi:hypothetical protein
MLYYKDSGGEMDKEFEVMFEGMYCYCLDEELGDPFTAARAKEIYVASKLGHSVSKTLSGPDAYNQKGEPVEYKSTTGKHPKGSYTGISKQPTWKEQERYLREEKIANYPEHYFNRFEDGMLVESWMMKGEDVYDILLPKLKKQFFSQSIRKDPRLSADITWTEIKKYGTKVI